jgi:N-acetylmuramoyl-L-alanine amidase
VAIAAAASVIATAGGGEPGAAAAAAKPPLVVVQAGHVAPREPGYRWQTGSGSGPFGNERAFNIRVSRALAKRLRKHGIRVRVTPGKISPWAVKADVFVAVHHDGPGGVAGVGHAHAGAREFFYHGDGAGEPSPTPYADTVRHRRATSVNTIIERRSRRLATRISVRMATLFTVGNGARSGWDGVLPKRLVRTSNYYGFRRTRAKARVIVEVGAAGADDRYLRKVDLIAAGLSRSIRDYLTAERGR